MLDSNESGSRGYISIRKAVIRRKVSSNTVNTVRNVVSISHMLYKEGLGVAKA